MAKFELKYSSKSLTTIVALLRRESDGYLYDWSDSSFKSSPITVYSAATADAVMLEVYAITETLADGLYTAFFFDTAAGVYDPAASSLLGWDKQRIESDAEAVAPTIAEILAAAVEGSTTIRGALRVMLALLAGKTTGSLSSTVAFRDQADSKDRVAATFDGNGNRTSVTVDEA